MLLDDANAAFSLVDVAHQLAQGRAPLPLQRLGRLVAILKPLGGVVGLVVGDFLRQLVARTLAQQFGPAFDAAMQPHQHALSTRAGSEALVHSPQAACDIDPSRRAQSCPLTASVFL